MPATHTFLPGPPQILPGRPDAVVDLQTDEGAALVAAQWRYHDAEVREVGFVGVGEDLGPSGAQNRTYDIEPHAEGVDVDDSGWQHLAPADTRRRLSTGKVCFGWYRTTVTIPERVGDLDPTGGTVVFEVVVDDYAEVWVDGRLPIALGASGGPVVAGFNAPNRVVLTRDAHPGQRFQIAVFGINGPVSAAPANYIWFRTATLDLYRPERARSGVEVAYDVDRVDERLDDLVSPGTPLEQVATGFSFTEGPVWSPDGALLFSDPNANTVYRWSEPGAVTVFRAKSGYTGSDIGRYHQPGSNGLTFDPDGRLTMCQHGNRQVLRVERRGNTTVLADRYDGRRLNSPNDLVHAADGTLFFTDPPFGLPGGPDDPKRELDFSGVFCVRDGAVHLLTDELAGPNGIALSPDERFLYVGDWDPHHKVVMRYELDPSLEVVGSDLLFDMTDAPGEDAIDGLKVDEAGNLYVCGPGGIWVLSPDGDHLGTLHLPEAPHNLAWGDEDGRTLYVTALTSVYRIRTAVPGDRP
ncbi:MAG TPA: SMP-30/gluconolactonase/LRE family protein [Nocardioidaceae bacterium]|nr:SMP-30/gluconolactonase/LRE family protein [Nocardioidaceae bacterium]